MLRRAKSVGVFQLEGAAMRQTLRALAPTSFDDVAALVALYRPGPMAANMHRDYPELKNGRKELTYLHPDIEPILKDTYGLMLYQESVMRVAQKFAGYSLEEADNLRKACGKKIRKLIAAEREKFIAGCVTEGYGEELGTQLFDIIEPFADYAFNKSHSYGYGLVAYQTAWLKAHYPVEYMSALLTSVKDNKDKTAVYLAECRSMGIDVLVPDVNRSLAEFAPDRQRRRGRATGRTAIVFGLAAVRNVGESLVERIVAERTANGPFVDIFDFCARVDPVVLNKRTMESLVKGGAFDSLGHPRQGLCLVLESIVDRSIERRKEQDLGITTLFAAFEEEESRSRLGRGQGGHPRQRVRQGAAPGLREGDARPLRERPPPHGLRGGAGPLHRQHPLGHAGGRHAGGGPLARCASVGGVVTDLRRSYTKKGDLMARFVLEDLQAAMEVFVFPKTMAEYGALIENDAILVIRGRLDTREEEPKIVCMEVSPSRARTGPGGPPHHPAPRGADRRQGRRAQGRLERASGAVAGPVARRRQGACACRRSSMWTAATAWWASSSGCSARAPSSPETVTSGRNGV